MPEDGLGRHERSQTQSPACIVVAFWSDSSAGTTGRNYFTGVRSSRRQIG